MKIIVDRFKSNREATLSHVSVVGNDGEIVFGCYGLEDEKREIKVPGETRIPAGQYRVTVRTEGGFHARYTNDRRVSDIHQGMLWVRDVPNFEFILIHIGNTERDTSGCLLVGAAADQRRMFVYRSVEAYRNLYEKVIGAAINGDLTIEFQDNDVAAAAEE